MAGADSGATKAARGIEYYPRSLREKYLLDERVQDDSGLCAKEMPDISWVPDAALFEKRSAARAYMRELQPELPPGWPNELRGPLVWSGEDWKSEKQFVYMLSEAERLDLRSALVQFKSRREQPVITA